MNGKFTLRKDKGPNEKGEYCVYLQYSTMGVAVKKSTGIWVKPEYWMDDNDDGKYIATGKNGHPKGTILNQKLINKKKGYDRIIEELLTEPNSVITVPMMQSILNGTYKERLEIDKGKVPFIDYVLQINGDLYKMEKISYSVWENIQCGMNRFSKFLNQELSLTTTLYCKDLTAGIIKKYIEWRKKEGNTNDTINKALTPIFKAVKKMIRLEWIDRNEGEDILELYLPTQKVSLAENDSDRHYLTEPQVKQLIQISEQSKYPRTKEFVDMFIFSILCGGMRFSDVCTLRWSEVDMDKRMIKHLQVKNHTKRPTILNLPISEECEKILMKWKGRTGNFVFGMLADDFDLNDEQMLKNTLNSQNKCINQSLKVLGKKMELPFNLHFHCSRHTFATLSLNKNVDLNVISHIMGHSSTWVTQKVYSKYLPETLSGVVNDKLNFKFS